MRSICILFFFTVHCLIANAQQWSEYEPISDGIQNGVSYSQYIREYAPKAYTVYWKLKNSYAQPVDIDILFVKRDGTTQKDQARLNPGEEKKSPGTWTTCPIVSATGRVRVVQATPPPNNRRAAPGQIASQGDVADAPINLTNNRRPAPVTTPLKGNLGRSWRESEYGGAWQGNWIRRGDSLLFDAMIRNGTSTKTFVATVSQNGRTLHIVSSKSSDGRDCIYDGSISDDGRSVSGTYTFSGGGIYRWQATINR